ncbi:MAG: hypothetical protein NDJ75_11095, partial [Thermoanaerobaculia bacterium]|nr:hypothetical protein [Thermoanaerobaculia bacterium]
MRIGAGCGIPVIAALALAAPAAAADAASDEVAAEARGAAAIFDSVTVVGSKIEERVGEIAGTASVIARDEIDRRQAQSLEDVVRHEPGVSAVGQAGR